MRSHLFGHQTEEEGVAEFPKIVEERRPCVRILNDVLQSSLIVTEDTGGAVVIPEKSPRVKHTWVPFFEPRASLYLGSLHCFGMALIRVLVNDNMLSWMRVRMTLSNSSMTTAMPW